MSHAAFGAMMIEEADDDAVDFAFLAAQTFDDIDLQREVLALFVAQAQRILSQLPDLGAREQADAAHLLKGSARGIGAWAVATHAAAYEEADGGARRVMVRDLEAAVERVKRAIAAHAVFGGS